MKRLLLILIIAFVGCTDTLNDEESKSKTIILPSLPHLEWMTENLSGFGGTEIDGRWYYTWEEAMAAAEQLGDGWRLPTQKEFEQLCELGSTRVVWEGCWVGGNHASNHKGSLFLPATGTFEDTGKLTHVGAWGYYWSSSILPHDRNSAWLLGIDSRGAYMGSATNRSRLNSVRLVRSV